MDTPYEAKYHQLEEINWWFVSRRNIVLQLVNETDINMNDKILEIGCSGGPLLKSLKQNGFTNTYGIDISDNAINECRNKGIVNVSVMDAAKTQFKDKEFDLIIASDVLEHLKDDNAALTEWHRLLKPNGKLIIFVPAHKYLWSNHDEINNHYRRYSKSELIERIRTANFKIERKSYWNLLALFPVTLLQIISRSQWNNNETKDHLFELHPGINKILINILKLENQFLKRGDFPIGISLFVVCEKH